LAGKKKQEDSEARNAETVKGTALLAGTF